MKYLVLIADGMSDLPLSKLHGKTPLEVSYTPNMDYMAKNGIVGWTCNVPKGMEPGSDVAAVSIFGYDPNKCYTGRGPLEAASLGIKLAKNEIAFRCNLVSVEKGRMKDFTAGHISSKEAGMIMRHLDGKIGSDKIKFFPGLSYRNLLVISEELISPGIKGTPPHDITGREIGKYLPRGRGSDLLIKLMNESEVLLHGMKTKATMIWPWGQGKKPQMSSFQERYNKRGAVITAVHLLKGLAKIVGMDSIDVPGATGYIDTNYRGKAEYAIKALKTHDIVFVHVEAPDEAGHEGDIRKKIKAIEDFDKFIVGAILRATRVTGYPDTRILVLPDHPTPIRYMTHTADRVPFMVYLTKGGIRRWDKKARQEGKTGGQDKRAKQKGKRAKEEGQVVGIKGFSEREVKRSDLIIKKGSDLLRYLFRTT
jgi:2,3-bisphosphoglycerate-independent phosphoglycerate mutase